MCYRYDKCNMIHRFRFFAALRCLRVLLLLKYSLMAALIQEELLMKYAKDHVMVVK